MAIMPDVRYIGLSAEEKANLAFFKRYSSRLGDFFVEKYPAHPAVLDKNFSRTQKPRHGEPGLSMWLPEGDGRLDTTGLSIRGYICVPKGASVSLPKQDVKTIIDTIRTRTAVNDLEIVGALNVTYNAPPEDVLQDSFDYPIFDGHTKIGPGNGPRVFYKLESEVTVPDHPADSVTISFETNRAPVDADFDKHTKIVDRYAVTAAWMSGALNGRLKHIEDEFRLLVDESRP